MSSFIIIHIHVQNSFIQLNTMTSAFPMLGLVGLIDQNHYLSFLIFINTYSWEILMRRVTNVFTGTFIPIIMLSWALRSCPTWHITIWGSRCIHLQEKENEFLKIIYVVLKLESTQMSKYWQTSFYTIKIFH